MVQCEDREEGAPPSKTTLCGEHETKAQRKRRRRRRKPEPGPSCVSLKSDLSKRSPINFKGQQASAAERLSQSSWSSPRPHFNINQMIYDPEPDSDHLPLKSDELIELSLILPSIILDSDECPFRPESTDSYRSKDDRIYFNTEPRQRCSPAQRRSLSSPGPLSSPSHLRPSLRPDSPASDSSCVSMKSDDSKEIDINFKRRGHTHSKSDDDDDDDKDKDNHDFKPPPSPAERHFLRPDSPASDSICVSLKSDDSKVLGIDF